MLMLGDGMPLVSGGNTDVYGHPQDCDLLIKLPRAASIERAKAKAAFWYGHERRYRHMKNMLRSLREQIALYAQVPSHSPHLERVVGLVETDRGIGLIVEAARQADGTLAPTLLHLLRDGGFDEAAEQRLRAFCDWMIRSPIVVNDFSIRNLVYAQPAGRDPHFVLIDGYGETATLPLKSWIGRLNRHDKTRKVAALYARLGIGASSPKPVYQPSASAISQGGAFAHPPLAVAMPQG